MRSEIAAAPSAAAVSTDAGKIRARQRAPLRAVAAIPRLATAPSRLRLAPSTGRDA